MEKHYPTSSAQDQVLTALGLDRHAYNYDSANDLFRVIGLSVSFKRIGRTSVPVVSLTEGAGGAFNAHGEGESWTIDRFGIDLTPLAPWMSEADATTVARRTAKSTPVINAATFAADHIAEQERERMEARERKERDQEARRQRAITRNILRIHGYTFTRFETANDDDETEVSYTLYAPDGRIVTVAQALAEIEARKQS